MKITKGRTALLVALGITLVVFNVIAFVVPFVRLGAFWIGYGFTMAAIILSFAVSGYAFRSKSMRSRFYGLSVAAVVWGYFLVQTLWSLAFMALSFIIPAWVAAVACVVLLAVCLLGLIATDAANDAVARVDHHIQQKTFYLKGLQANVEGMRGKVQDAVLHKALGDLAESIRYSDPMSAGALAPLEEKIEAKTAELGEYIDAGDVEAAKALCPQIQVLVAERSRKCRLLK